MTLTCQKRVINIVVGRRGWLGNIPELLGQARLPSTVTGYFPRPFKLQKPALPQLTTRDTAVGILC